MIFGLKLHMEHRSGKLQLQELQHERMQLYNIKKLKELCDTIYMIKLAYLLRKKQLSRQCGRP